MGLSIYTSPERSIRRSVEKLLTPSARSYRRFYFGHRPPKGRQLQHPGTDATLDPPFSRGPDPNQSLGFWTSRAVNGASGPFTNDQNDPNDHVPDAPRIAGLGAGHVRSPEERRETTGGSEGCGGSVLVCCEGSRVRYEWMQWDTKIAFP